MAIFLGEIEGTSKGTSTLEQTGHLWVTRNTRDRSYFVLAEDSDRELEVLAVAGIPALLNELDDTLCISRVPTEMHNVDYQGSDYILWKVDCHWDSNRTTSIQEGDLPPEFRRARIAWYGENEEEQLYFDPITNEPIVNEAGEFIFVSHPVVRPVLEVSRFEIPPFDPDTILAFCNHTNLLTFYGAPTGCALMLPITVREEVISGDVYNRVTYRIKFAITNGLEDPDDSNSAVIMKPDGWKTYPLHEGNWAIDPATGNPVPAEVNGVRGRQRLNPDGHVIPPGTPVIFSEAFLDFNRYAKSDFNLLGLHQLL